MIRRIGTVKKEIRTLGLDTCNPRLTVAVVGRGGLYLDGVISFPSDPKGASGGCARRIIESAYFPELRAIMLHNPNEQLDSTLLERLTNLTTITISKDKPRHYRGYAAFHGNMGRLWVKTRLESITLKTILCVSWTIDRLPEPLRVAHFLAKLEMQGGSHEIKDKFAGPPPLRLNSFCSFAQSVVPRFFPPSKKRKSSWLV